MKVDEGQIWVVSYWEDVTPTIFIFSNEEAALDCYNYYNKFYDNCSIDKTFLNTHFHLS